jgi:purine nucleosidase
VNKLIIDCDPGIDDAFALMLACGSPEIELLAVTAVAGNRPLPITAANACRVLDIAGRPDVPVHAGCARAIANTASRSSLFHGEGGLGGAVLAAQREPAGEHAVDFLVRTLRDTPADTLALNAIGPLTNLALAEILHPGLLKRLRSLRFMGGAVFCPGNVTPAAEFNFHADAVAAHVVINAGAKLHMFGLDVTSQVRMPAPWIESFAELDSHCGRAALAMLRPYDRQDRLLHDVCPVAHLLDATLFAGQPQRLTVDWGPGPAEGRVAPTDAAGDDSRAVVVTQVDAPRLLALVRQRIARLP